MNILEWIIVVVIALPILNLLPLAIYCRQAEKIDRKSKTNRPKSGEEQIEEFSLPQKSIMQSINQYLYGWMRYSSILVGRFPSNRVRNWIFRHVFRMKATKRTVINGGCELRSPWNITAGTCIIGNNSILDGRAGIEIGDHVVLGSGVHIWTMEHDVNDPWFRVTAEHFAPVKIDNRAWICSDSSILPGTHIGCGAVIASKACVVQDCKAYEIYGGIPAKRIGVRTRGLKFILDGKPPWHFY